MGQRAGLIQCGTKSGCFALFNWEEISALQQPAAACSSCERQKQAAQSGGSDDSDSDVAKGFHPEANLETVASQSLYTGVVSLNRFRVKYQHHSAMLGAVCTAHAVRISLKEKAGELLQVDATKKGTRSCMKCF